MEMEKKNTGLIIALIISIILVLGLGGYIVYDKFITDNEVEVPQDNNNENEDDNGVDNYTYDFIGTYTLPASEVLNNRTVTLTLNYDNTFAWDFVYLGDSLETTITEPSTETITGTWIFENNILSLTGVYLQHNDGELFPLDADPGVINPEVTIVNTNTLTINDGVQTFTLVR